MVACDVRDFMAYSHRSSEVKQKWIVKYRWKNNEKQQQQQQHVGNVVPTTILIQYQGQLDRCFFFVVHVEHNPFGIEQTSNFHQHSVCCSLFLFQLACSDVAKLIIFVWRILEKKLGNNNALRLQQFRLIFHLF